MLELMATATGACRYGTLELEEKRGKVRRGKARLVEACWGNEATVGSRGRQGRPPSLLCTRNLWVEPFLLAPLPGGKGVAQFFWEGDWR